MRRYLALVVTLAALSAPAAAQACPPIKGSNALARKAWDYPHKRAKKVRKVRLIARCTGKRIVRRHIADARRAYKRDRAKAQREAEAARYTPYPGPNGTRWAIPYSIVYCESRGDFGARNSSSTAGGAYQILASSWRAYGGTAYADSHPAAVAPQAEQHMIASRIWNGGAGRSQWAC